MVILTLLAYGVYKENIKAENLSKKSHEKDSPKVDDPKGDVNSVNKKERPISPKQFPEHDDKIRYLNYKV